MTHPLVTQLEFTRREFVRVMEGVSAEEGERVIPPFNSLSFVVAHMAFHEHTMFVLLGQGVDLGLDVQVAHSGTDASVPSWNDMWTQWQQITDQADSYLQRLAQENLHVRLRQGDREVPEVLGHTLLRVIYHYWFHLGEAHAIRQVLGHKDIPEFVGAVGTTSFE